MFFSFQIRGEEVVYFQQNKKRLKPKVKIVTLQPLQEPFYQL
jgi:hypothetical protein